MSASDRPFIPRGLIEVEGGTSTVRLMVEVDDVLTFSRIALGWHLVYHAAPVVSCEGGVITCLVGPSTLVTWDRSLDG